MQPPGPVPQPYQQLAIDPTTRFCPSCGGIGEPKRENRGSLGIELLLWVTCVGGLIYSIWRRSNKLEKCPYCSAEGVVLPNSPRARQILGGG